jgi:hypothetical protein
MRPIGERAENGAVVGRMCWRYQPTLEWRPREESPAVTHAREGLLGELALAARGAPGDDWILGQRVRYLLEVGRLQEARVLAGECGGAPGWWCGALEGLILHLQGRYPKAERAFRGGLRKMEPGDYRLELEVSLMGRNPLVREIVVQVADPGGVPAAA